jgi:DNA polymerase II small subunit/DNA polymerase delta subunit B
MGGNLMVEKKTTEAQYRASQKYKKEKVKRITVDFSPVDSDLWEHIQNQPNKQGYIKALIRADMNK